MVLLGTVAWFGYSPETGKLLGAITLLVTLLEQERRDHFKLSTWDEKLMKEFLNELSCNSDPIIYLREHDMGGSFPTEKFFTPLASWTEKWKGEQYRFKKKSLEQKRKAFYDALDSFTWNISDHTYPHHNVPHMSSMEYDDCFNSPEKDEIRKKLNESRRKAYKAYIQMIEEIRKNS